MAVIRGSFGEYKREKWAWRAGSPGQPQDACQRLRLLLLGVIAMHWPANSRHNGRDTDRDLIKASHRPLKQIHMKILPDKFRGQAEWRRNG